MDFSVDLGKLLAIVNIISLKDGDYSVFRQSAHSDPYPMG